MKKTLMATSVVILSAFAAWAGDATVITNNASTSAWNDDNRRFGVGVILGEPTGASLKYWLNDTMAIDGALGASFNDDDDNDSDFYMHSDLLWHNFDLLPVPQGKLPVYFGVGGLVRFRSDEDNQVGIRIPVGLSYMFEDLPIDIFAEIGPAIDVAPDIRGEITGGLGVRVWF